MTIRTEKCKDCFFWLQENENLLRQHMGVCRRFPLIPGVQHLPGQNALTREPVLVPQRWQTLPITTEDEFCGEFRVAGRIALN